MRSRTQRCTLFPYTTLFRSIFEDVKLTRANLVGGEGQGFKIAMKTFDRSRPWIAAGACGIMRRALEDRKSTRLNSSHRCISYAVFCLKKKTLMQGVLSMNDA